MSKIKESKMDSRALEKRLSGVRETSEEIQNLSRWCLQHKNHHHSIIQAWSRAVRKSKVPHRLTLFYVCNDIVQNARRKKVHDMVQHYATAIKEAAPLVRDEKIRPKIIRIFNIWEERGIYDAKLIAEFTEIVENVGTVNASENEIVLSSFQPVQLVEGIRTVVALEKSTESLRTDLRNQDFSLTDDEINQLRQTVKERGTSRERMEEFEEAVVALECYLASVQKEIEERTQVVTLLEQAEIFYETQRGEAKLVANAYKNFGNRVKVLKSKLLEKMKTLPEPSPVPSPTPDAPSPENSDEEDLSLPDSGPQGIDSFLNSSAFAEFAKDAFTSSGNLDSRLSALHKIGDSPPPKTYPDMSMSAVLEMEIKDVHSSREASPNDDIQEVWEIPQRVFPARDSMERDSHGKAVKSMEHRDSSDRRMSVEPRDSSSYKDLVESRDKGESLEQSKSHSRWDLKDSRSLRDADDRKDNHDHSSSSSRRDVQDHKEMRDSWDRDADHREYSHSSSRERERERRSSRSSRDSRDSHEAGSGERDNYRSGSWDHVGNDREYSHKSRDRDYSHSHNSSYDTSLQIPKDLKPMSAAELLDTFGKVLSKSLSTGSNAGTSSSFDPVTPPAAPVAPVAPVSQPPMPDLSRPPPSLSIPLPPSNPPTTESSSPYSTAPSGIPSPYTPTKPIYHGPYSVPPASSPKPSYCPPLPPPPPPPPPPSSAGSEPVPFPPYESAAAPAWIPPPPPPPPPPELMENEIPHPGSEFDSGNRSFSQAWSDYDDDESDDRNWGEPPGNEELEALTSDTPSSPPPYEKGFMGRLAPPPLPPAFCATRSNLRELVSEDSRTNLVSITPKANTIDTDYRCYNYSSLSEEPKPAPVPSIQSLFSSESDQDLRVKKAGLKQGRTESGSDMDISNSDSEDNMDISDESGKEGGNNKSGDISVKRNNVGVIKTVNHRNTKGSINNQDSKRDSPVVVAGVKNVKGVSGSSHKSDSGKRDAKPITSIVSNSGVGVPDNDDEEEEAVKEGGKEEDEEEEEGEQEEEDKEAVMSMNAKEVESILSQMRKASSVSSVNRNNNSSSDRATSNVRVLTSAECDELVVAVRKEVEERELSENNGQADMSKSASQVDDESSNGPLENAENDGYELVDHENSQSDISDKLEPIPSVIANTGLRVNIDEDYNSHSNVTEGNMIGVIDVMKNLDREFNQQRSRGNRGGGGPHFTNRGRGGATQFGRGERFTSPHSVRGWNHGGPVFNTPRGRGRGHRGDFNHGTPPYSPSSRGFRGSDPNRGGRNWWGPKSWF